MLKKWMLLCFAFPALLQAQNMNATLDKIRNNEAALTAFFTAMPKGGDLHHHYSGSVYAETYVQYIVTHHYFIHPATLTVKAVLPDHADNTWVNVDSLSANDLASYKNKLLQHWSVKDFQPCTEPADQHFFNTFGYFDEAVNGTLATGLQELKSRALYENVSYLETMLHHFSTADLTQSLISFNNELGAVQQRKDTVAIQQLIGQLYAKLYNPALKRVTLDFNQFVQQLHDSLQLDDQQFTIRYQNYVVRTKDPLNVLAQTIAAFESANTSPLIVGVNIVAPENNEVAMHDYWLHMQFFKFCHQQFPRVKFAMHAGELTLNQVAPEQLSWHITAALQTAGANRIGHGVAIGAETNGIVLLQQMKRLQIPVEINLYSNEFILGVKNSVHPLLLYHRFKVPIVISSDDAGVLRSSLTQQFVLLASRYPTISYNDIKNFVFNSIRFSFIEKDALKTALLADCSKRFTAFEKKIGTVLSGTVSPNQ